MAKNLSDKEIDEVMIKANDLLGVEDQLQPLHKRQVNDVLNRSILRPDSLTKGDLDYIRRTRDFYKKIIEPF